ncbi:MAG: replication restart helicase PriA [Chitinophagaceae bacterium]
MYASVILPLALPQIYTWEIPKHLSEKIALGMRVEVILRKKTHYIGVVYQLHEHLPAVHTKNIQPILAIIDEKPILSELQLKLWKFISEYYLCSIGEVMKAALPSPLRLNSDLYIIFNTDDPDTNFSDLNVQEYLLVEELSIKKKIKWNEAIILLKEKNIYPYIQTLFFKNICTLEEEFQIVRSEKKQNHILLNKNKVTNDLSATQKKIIEVVENLLKDRETITKKILIEKSKTSISTIKRLIDLEVLYIGKKNTCRIDNSKKKISLHFTLSKEQQQAFNKWKTTNKIVTLLQGVTGSGKTHIYIKTIEKMLQENKQSLYLLPEILITTQLIQKMQSYFGGHVGYFHSKMNIHERLEIWQKIQQKEISILIGVRSSIFLPFQNLGLIICDEEHDASYKQSEPSPRYNARDVAIWLATQYNAKIIIGSATPSLESYFNAQEGKYNYLQLHQRYTNIPMPEITIFDLKKYISGTRKEPWISPPLIEKIQEQLNQKKQLLFFQNRRGYAPYILCGNCGWIAYCKNCHLPLSYHKTTHQLTCHTCNYIQVALTSCPTCKQENLLYKQFGTQKLEEILQEHFPNLRIARVDWDTTKSKLAFQKIIQQFSEQKIDALVGTQMIAKGLDFPNLSMVVIPNADNLLFFHSFRNNERFFQTIEQVGGRSGRNKQGEVFIQTTQTEHPIFHYLKHHDYHAFAKAELKIRKDFFYPPYSRIIKIIIKHQKETLCHQGAFSLYQQLKTQNIPSLYPPIIPFAYKIKNLYIQHIYLKLPNQSNYIWALKKYLLYAIQNIKQQKALSHLIVIVDVDNMD